MATKKTESARGERILVLNPGSTSTKLAIYDGSECTFEDRIQHTQLDLSRFESVWDQYEYRKKLILDHDTDSVELYDLASDPGETRNLAGDEPELVTPPTPQGSAGVQPRVQASSASAQ